MRTTDRLMQGFFVRWFSSRECLPRAQGLLPPGFFAGDISGWHEDVTLMVIGVPQMPWVSPTERVSVAISFIWVLLKEMMIYYLLSTRETLFWWFPPRDWWPFSKHGPISGHYFHWLSFFLFDDGDYYFSFSIFTEKRPEATWQRAGLRWEI